MLHKDLKDFIPEKRIKMTICYEIRDFLLLLTFKQDFCTLRNSKFY